MERFSERVNGHKSTARTLILVNPQARGGKIAGQWPQLRDELFAALEEAFGESKPQVEFTSAEDHGSGRVRKALTEGARRIVVVGGDGTVSEAAQGFFKTPGGTAPVARDAVLVVMPAGRGDDFFKSLQGRTFYSAHEVWCRALETVRGGNPEPVDVGRISWTGGSSHFINIVSFGYPGMVVQRVQERKGRVGRSPFGRGAWTYLFQTVASLRDYVPREIEVEVDGKVAFRGEVFSGFVLNGCWNGGGMRWSREARIDDGEFDVIVIRPGATGPFQEKLKSWIGRAPTSAAMVSGMIKGDWNGIDGVEQFRGRKIRVRDLGPAVVDTPFFEADGDILDGERAPVTDAEFEVIPSAIRILR